MTDRNIWVISDLHLQHEKILTWDNGRTEFSSIKEMDECLLDNWNEVVNPQDIVYNLGDVFFGNRTTFIDLWRKFQGRKRLIVGNHDDIKFLAPHFQKIQMWRMFPEFGVVLSHVPIHECSFKEKGPHMVNVHGHTHRWGSPPGDYVSVCCELTGYKPVNIEDIRSKLPNAISM